MITRYVVDADKRFARELEAAQKAGSDLRGPLKIMAADWRASEAELFENSGPSFWPDLAPSTKKSKARAGYSVYPILVRTGRLRDSLIIGGHPEGITRYEGATTVIIGTAVPYAKYLHARRPFLFVGNEQRRAPKIIRERTERWSLILKAHLVRALK